MEQFESINDLLDFAIQREEESIQFYTDLAERSISDNMTEVFKSFAEEERRHKKKLENVKIGERLLPAAREVLDLKIGDYLVEVEPQPDVNYQDALIIAMKREKAAFRLYSDLAARTDDAELQDLFGSLAQEEAKHKLRFEVEYDNHFLEGY